MELMIGDKLKKLRRNRDLTQEEVAAHIGISYQAISKWERGDGYPDITMLPTLANYFGVSIDELIGMDEISSAQRLDDINQKWQENRAKGAHKENVELMRNALKTYPNNALLLMQLSCSLERLEGTEKEKKEYLKELSEQIDDLKSIKMARDIKNEALKAAEENLKEFQNVKYIHGNHDEIEEIFEKMHRL